MLRVLARGFVKEQPRLETIATPKDQLNILAGCGASARSVGANGDASTGFSTK
jgi:hypothetical protein